MRGQQTSEFILKKKADGNLLKSNSFNCILCLSFLDLFFPVSAPEKEAVPRSIYLIRVLFTIQVWRGYSQRKKTENLREEEMIFLGMVSGAVPREHNSHTLFVLQAFIIQPKRRNYFLRFLLF